MYDTPETTQPASSPVYGGVEINPETNQPYLVPTVDQAIPAELEAPFQTEGVAKQTYTGQPTTGQIPSGPPYIKQADDGPAIGGAVQVTYYDGNHNLFSTVAHVLAITGTAADLATPDGQPALTVAYPDPTADPSILSGVNWQKGYVRKTGVVHYSHPLAVNGEHSVVWGYPVHPSATPHLMRPAGDGSNPIFQRPVDADVREVQMGLHGSPALRSESDYPLEGGAYPRTGQTPEGASPRPGGGYPVGDMGHYSDGSPVNGRTQVQPLASNVDKVRAEDGGNLIPTNQPAGYSGVSDPGNVHPRALGDVQLGRIQPGQPGYVQTIAQTPPVSPVVPISQAPQPAQDAAIAAADLSAHNAAVAADQAGLVADNAVANADVVHNAE